MSNKGKSHPEPAHGAPVSPGAHDAHGGQTAAIVKPPSALKAAITEKISLFAGVLKTTPGVIRDSIRETIAGVRSPDRPTRRTSRWFVFFLVAALLVVGKGGQLAVRNWREKRAVAEAVAAAAVVRAAEVEAERKRRLPPPFVSIGVFVLELRAVPGRVNAKGSLNSAEMEVVVTCDEIELCDWLKENLPLARAELGPLFVPMERDRLLTIQGKRAFREEIRDQLNRFLEKRGRSGTVLEVLLPRFIIS